jgi:sugar lactone lactonase YvrE
MYNVACGYALTGKPAETITQLEALAAMSLYFDVMHDDDLVSLRSLQQFTSVVDRLEGLKKATIGKSTQAFTLPERDTIAEGVAFDPKTGAFFVSSVFKRKIVRVLPDGKTNDFVSDGLFAVLGLAVDEKRRALWACTSAIPEMTGFTETDKGQAKVVEYDIDSGQQRRALSLGEPGENHMCNDLTVDSEGNVFVSDPGASILYTLPVGAKALDVFVSAGSFAAPQGIALTRDGKSMFVADYSRGLFHVDRTNREVTWLMPPNDAALVGIDGLAMVQNDLIAIQNGLRPFRVLRISVDVAAKAVRRVEILQMNHPAFDEPTLGVVVGKTLFYVANSQWGSFDKGVLWPVEKLKEPVILRLGLD